MLVEETKFCTSLCRQEQFLIGHLERKGLNSDALLRAFASQTGPTDHHSHTLCVDFRNTCYAVDRQLPAHIRRHTVVRVDKSEFRAAVNQNPDSLKVLCPHVVQQRAKLQSTGMSGKTLHVLGIVDNYLGFSSPAFKVLIPNVATEHGKTGRGKRSMEIHLEYRKSKNEQFELLHFFSAFCLCCRVFNAERRFVQLHLTATHFEFDGIFPQLHTYVAESKLKSQVKHSLSVLERHWKIGTTTLL